MIPPLHYSSSHLESQLQKKTLVKKKTIGAQAV